MSEPMWAVVELMGHVRLGGRVSEVEMFGVKMGRIDIPQGGDAWLTRFFGGQAVYSLTPTDEATARLVAARSEPAPVHPYELPRAPAALPYQKADGPDRDPDDEEDDDDRRDDLDF